MSKLTPQQMDNSQLNELVLKRLQAAYQAGIKLTVLSSKAGLTGWRVRTSSLSCELSICCGVSFDICYPLRLMGRG